MGAGTSLGYDEGMRGAWMTGLLLVIGCGGRIAASGDADGSVRDASPSLDETALDGGTADSTSVPEDAGVVVSDSGEGGHMIDAADAGLPCYVVDGRLGQLAYECGSTVFPQCPFGIQKGDPCSIEAGASSNECVTCGDTPPGRPGQPGQEYLCTSNWILLNTMLSCQP